MRTPPVVPVEEFAEAALLLKPIGPPGAVRCAARGVNEGRDVMSGSEQVGACVARGDGPEDYDATVTGGVGLVARRVGLAGGVAGGSGLRSDGPSIRMVIQ